MGVELSGRRRSRASGSCAAAGFSVVEGLIAAAILLLIAVGILPLFLRSMVNNSAGNDATQSTNYVRGELERLIGLRFSDPAFVGPPTLGSAIVSTRYLLENDSSVKGDETWEATQPVRDSERTELWGSTTSVRRFELSSLDDGLLRSSEAMTGTPLPEQVHFVDMEVEIHRSFTAGSALRTTPVTMHAVKSF